MSWKRFFSAVSSWNSRNVFWCHSNEILSVICCNNGGNEETFALNSSRRQELGSTITFWSAGFLPFFDVKYSPIVGKISKSLSPGPLPIPKILRGSLGSTVSITFFRASAAVSWFKWSKADCLMLELSISTRRDLLYISSDSHNGTWGISERG